MKKLVLFMALVYGIYSMSGETLHQPLLTQHSTSKIEKKTCSISSETKMKLKSVAWSAAEGLFTLTFVLASEPILGETFVVVIGAHMFVEFLKRHLFINKNHHKESKYSKGQAIAAGITGLLAMPLVYGFERLDDLLFFFNYASNASLLVTASIGAVSNVFWSAFNPDPVFKLEKIKYLPGKIKSAGKWLWRKCCRRGQEEALAAVPEQELPELHHEALDQAEMESKLAKLAEQLAALQMEVRQRHSRGHDADETAAGVAEMPRTPVHVVVDSGIVHGGGETPEHA